tara:strand:- start:787 stop:1374 length:588 start_codon:yes stop_codon:yes gene_type:complete
MGKVVNFPQTLEKHLAKLRTNGGIYEFKKGKFAILHKEVERLANDYGIETEVELKYCDLPKSCAVVKATARYQGNKFTSLGEASPLNNEFPYPIAVAEKRAADRVILKALNIHGDLYSQSEIPPQQRNENQGIKLEHSEIILERIKNSSHQANLEQLQRENKDYLLQLAKQNSTKAKEIMTAFENKKQQLIGGKK